MKIKHPEFPYQPFLGRAESLLALAMIFDGNADQWLKEHDELCRRLALQCVAESWRLSIAKVRPSDLRDAFLANVQAQSGSVESFAKVTALAKQSHSEEIRASESGFVTCDLKGVRDLFVNLQKQAQTADSEFPDPIGLIFLRRPGEWVARKIPLATVRISSKNRTVVLNRINSLIYTQPQSIGPMMASVQ